MDENRSRVQNETWSLRFISSLQVWLRGFCARIKGRDQEATLMRGENVSDQWAEKSSSSALPVTHLNDSLAAFGCTVECSFNREDQLKFNTGEKTWTPSDFTAYLLVYLYSPASFSLPICVLASFCCSKLWCCSLNGTTAFAWLTLKKDNKQIVYPRLGAHCQHQQAAVISLHTVT